jgi:hypothetical protein
MQPVVANGNLCGLASVDGSSTVFPPRSGPPVYTASKSNEFSEEIVSSASYTPNGIVVDNTDVVDGTEAIDDTQAVDNTDAIHESGSIHETDAIDETDAIIGTNIVGVTESIDSIEAVNTIQADPSNSFATQFSQIGLLSSGHMGTGGQLHSRELFNTITTLTLPSEDYEYATIISKGHGGFSPVFRKCLSESALTGLISEEKARSIAKKLPMDLSYEFYNQQMAKKPAASRFLALPREIRDMIYIYLLVNPILGTRKSIDEWYGYRVRAKYGLTPGILRTCRQMYEEGSSMLYGEENSFCVLALDRKYQDYDNTVNLSPLTRCRAVRKHIFRLTDGDSLGVLGPFSKIKHFKIVVSTFRGQNREIPCPQRNFIEICRVLCHFAPKKLEILVVPGGYESHDIRLYGDIVDALKPLDILRNVGEVIFRDADLEEIPDYFAWGDSYPSTPPKFLCKSKSES